MKFIGSILLILVLLTSSCSKDEKDPSFLPQNVNRVCHLVSYYDGVTQVNIEYDQNNLPKQSTITEGNRQTTRNYQYIDTKIIISDNNSDGTRTFTITYNNDGNPIQVEFDELASSYWRLSKILFHYNGKLLDKVEYQGADIDDKVIYVKYDSKNENIISQSLVKDGAPMVILEYDDSENPFNKFFFEPGFSSGYRSGSLMPFFSKNNIVSGEVNGSVETSRTYEYNSKNFPTQCYIPTYPTRTYQYICK